MYVCVSVRGCVRVCEGVLEGVRVCMRMCDGGVTSIYLSSGTWYEFAAMLTASLARRYVHLRL